MKPLEPHGAQSPTLWEVVGIKLFMDVCGSEATNKFGVAVHADDGDGEDDGVVDDDIIADGIK